MAPSMEKPILKLAALLATLVVVTPWGSDNPCEDETLVESIKEASTNATIVCLKPSQTDLETQLEKIGGYPKRFVAITPEDACNFTFPSIVEHLKNYQQYSAIPTQPSQPQRDSGLAEDHPQPRSRRIKRSPVSENSTQLSCIGKATRNNETGLFHMCDMCWYRTTLEEDKFPQEINEVVCHPDSSEISGGCLGHQFLGTCIQKVIELQFLKLVGYEIQQESTDSQIVYKQKWEPYTQQIRSCCECEASEELAESMS